MNRFRKTIGVIFALCCVLNSKGQNRLSGSILSGADSTGIGSAIIYLPDLNSQTLSDEKGHFSFANIPKGYYPVQVLKFGFKSYSTTLFIGDTLTTRNFYLKNCRTPS